MADCNSFLEVKPQKNCRVTIGGEVYELGDVKSIFASAPDYVVWLGEDDHVWYEIDHKKKTLGQEFHQFWSEYDVAKTRNRQHLTDQQTKYLQELFGSAVSSALEAQYSAAKDILKSATAFVVSANERGAKRRYLVGVVGSAFALGMLGLVLYAWYYYVDVPRVVQICAHALCGGAVGTILSCTTGKIRDARFDPNATRLEGYMNGALRVLYGCSAALVAVVAVFTGIIDSKLLTPANEPFFHFLFVSG